MTITIQELITQSHQTAIDKGWWKDGIESRPVEDIVNCFYSEVLEAFEEYRAGRMDMWFSCKEFPSVAVELHPDCDAVSRQDGRKLRCFRLPGAGCQLQWEHEDNGQFLKPEGFWVEISDLLVRIGDVFGAYKWKSNVNHCTPFKDGNISRFVWWLNTRSLSKVSRSVLIDNGTVLVEWTRNACDYLYEAILTCIATAECHGVNLLELCEMKMEYNKTRPYRHGNKKA